MSTPPDLDVRRLAHDIAHLLSGENYRITIPSSALVPAASEFAAQVLALADTDQDVLGAEVTGEQPFTWLDRNVICGDALAGPEVEPPKLTERLGAGQS